MISAHKYSTTVTIFLAAIFISSCGVTGRIGSRSYGDSTGEVIQSGVASWYGPNFHGNLTANGEVYNMYSLTAAHRTLPFNTFVRVHNLDNGKSVTVRINDRGPFAKNRSIDLSKKAATQIQMLGPGTARVRLYLVSGDPDTSKPNDLNLETYTVQLGSFQDEKRAIKRSGEIRGSRIEKAYLNNGLEVYRIYYGVFTDKSEAEAELERLRAAGYQGYVKQLEN